MTIWAHTLFKNEAKWLWYSVSSVINYVDKVLLWDAGSTDGSTKIVNELLSRYPEKIYYKTRIQKDSHDFAKIRQEMLDETKSDWFLMLDGDEIWWRESIIKIVSTIENKSNEIESIIVPTVNVVGDMYHYQGESAGRYKFGDRIGHYNLRAINRNIPGLKSSGEHGVWGWVDKDGNMIQDRSSRGVLYVDSPYVHTTFLQRADNKKDDLKVVKRAKKMKYEIGKCFSKDFYYPEVFFEDKPNFIVSPWARYNNKYMARAIVETPLRKLKRTVYWGRVGY